MARNSGLGLLTKGGIVTVPIGAPIRSVATVERGHLKLARDQQSRLQGPASPDGNVILAQTLKS